MAAMRVPCEACEGHGATTPDHPNDPDARIIDCEDCDGRGDREATASDLDGARVRYRYVTGYVSYERRNDTLTLVCEITECEVVNLQPEHLTCVP